MSIVRAERGAFSRVLGVVAVLALTAVVPFGATRAAARNGDETGTRRQEFHWSGTLAAGQTLEVHGLNGGIHAESAGGNEVVVDAVKSGRRSDPAEVEIRVTRDADGIRVCAVYPGGGGDCGDGEWHSHLRNNDVTVKYRLRVPAGVRLVAKTVNGGVEAAGLKGEVSAETVNGGITVSTAGRARCSTVNGGIAVRIGSGSWKEPLRFETVNGSIEVELPADAGAEVSAETVNGHISTDFPLTVVGTFRSRALHGTIGGGGGSLHLGSVNGSITLRRSSLKSVKGSL